VRAKAKNAWVVSVYGVTLAWMNIYICRELFRVEYTGHMNSMQGFWIALARIAGQHWVWPTWWPYWDSGMAFEYTYAPLLPGVTAAYAGLTGVSHASAFNVISGFVYCLTPLTLFVMAWVLTKSPGYSFAAGCIYSLTSPTAILAPDQHISLARFWDSRRIYLSAVWDETPHCAALALLALSVVFLYLSMQKRRPAYYLGAIVCISLTVLASAFGGLLLLIASLSLLWALDRTEWKRNALTIAALGVISYAIVCPFLPPSLIEIMRSDSQLHNDGWSLSSFAPLAGVALGWAIIDRLLHRFHADPPLRFFTLFAYVTTSIAAVFVYFHRQFVPQPGRYKVELEFAFALFIVFALRPVIVKQSAGVKVTLALLLIALAAEQVIGHRHFAKKVLVPVDITRSIEYRVSKWAEQHLPEQRIMVAGSMEHWLNAFSNMQEFSGSSYSTAQNPVKQMGVDAVLLGQSSLDVEREISLLWLTAFGTQAVAIGGPQSPEFWKPVKNPRKFDGYLDVLWKEDDTTIYRVPQRTASFAHVMPEASLVRTPPQHATDVSELRRYVGSLKDETLPPAEFRWDGYNRALIPANIRTNDVVSVQVTYHPGWHATVNGKSAKVLQDGLGMMWLKPNVTGPCAIQLDYNGGFELIACRIISILTLVALTTAYVMRRRKQRAAAVTSEMQPAGYS
jgi:hypothetical protein